MINKAEELKPIHMNCPNRWVLMGYTKTCPSMEYIFKNKDYPRFSISVVEKYERWSFGDFEDEDNEDPPKDKDRSYTVSIRKNAGGLHPVNVHVEVLKMKNISEVFQNQNILTLLKFFDKKEDKYLEDTKEDDLYEKEYEKIESFLKNIPHEWYSDYGCVAFAENLPIIEGIYNCISIKVTIKNKKTYLEFSEPLGIFKK